MSVTIPGRLAAKLQARADKRRCSIAESIRDCVETALTPARKSKKEGGAA